MLLLRISASSKKNKTVMEKIKDENLAPHYKLPSEDELAALYQVARGTIRQALSELSREHVIYRVHGKGTFVSAREREHVLDSLRFLSFWDEMVESSLEFQNKLLDVKRLTVKEAGCKHLNLCCESDPVISVRRVRTVDGKPIMYSNNNIPANLHPRILECSDELISIHEMLKTRCGIDIDFAQRIIEFTSAPEEVAQIMGIPTWHPIIFVEQIVYDVQGRCIDDGFVWLRNENFRFSVTMRKKR